MNYASINSYGERGVTTWDSSFVDMFEILELRTRLSWPSEVVSDNFFIGHFVVLFIAHYASMNT